MLPRNTMCQSIKIHQQIHLQIVEPLGFRVGSFYKAQRDTLVGLFETHLKDLATWYYPNTGFSAVLMPKGIKDAREFVAKYALKHAVTITCTVTVKFLSQITHLSQVGFI